MWNAENISYRFSDKSDRLLDGFNLTVGAGEVVGLTGPSGIGKSTLARIMTGHITPDAGLVTVNDVPVSYGPRRQAPVQLVLQHSDHAVNPNWTIMKILAEAHQDFGTAVDVGLVAELWLERFPHELSGGQLQRVNLARALLAAPSFIAADEITSSLDSLTQVMLWHLVLHRVRTERLGVLAISHNPALLRHIADRVVTIDRS